MNEETEKFEGHGNNWGAVFGNENFDVTKTITEIMNAEVFTVKSKNDYTSVISHNAPIRGLALIKKEEDKNVVWSGYPFLQISNPIEVSIEKIEEWSNGVEAIISGSVGLVSVSFFDTLYFLNKENYKIGQKYVFNIGAIGLYFEKRKEKDLILEPTEGPMKGEKLYTHKMTAFFPREKYGGEFEFVCPFVSFLGETTAFGEKFNIFPCWVRNRDTDTSAFTVPIYVNTKISNDTFKTGDSISGVGWLQGYLADSFDDTIALEN